jgi:hypothetical protein
MAAGRHRHGPGEIGDEEEYHPEKDDQSGTKKARIEVTGQEQQSARERGHW